MSLHSRGCAGRSLDTRIARSPHGEGARRLGFPLVAMLGSGGIVLNSKVRVVIADDDPMLLQLLRVALNETNISIAAEAQTGREAVEYVRLERPEVAIFDISMPELDGLEALAEAKSASPSTIFIVLTAHANVNHLARALSVGASAFLSKSNRDLRTIPSTVATLLRGEAAIVDHGLLQRAFRESRAEDPVLWPDCEAILRKLTPREKEVLRLIGHGKTNQQIASEIVVTYNTVKTHVQSILDKIGVSDRTQAALVAHRCGLTDGP